MAKPPEQIGSFALVLHTHLPWLAHHGAWPVGEEWLHQAWATSYLPVLDLLTRLGAEGRTDLLTLAVTPVLAAQLDDPYCRRGFHHWLGSWQLRAEELAASPEPALREVAGREFRASQDALAQAEGCWSAGLSPVLRPLVDAGVVELLGGPATHAFAPLLPDPVNAFALQAGLDDATARIGRRPAGIWAPECGYRPGLEHGYAHAGVRHFLVDGPNLLSAGRSTADGWTAGDSDVVAFGRDLEVTYRVWSPRKGYPGGRWYLDFHDLHHDSGFRPSRVTTATTPPSRKAPYDSAAARTAVEQDAQDFVAVVRRRLLDLRSERGGRPALTVAAFDTELFGHWWHEGPLWLERVLRLLPHAGVRVTTLASAAASGHVAGRVDLGPGSWGSGKDWRVWSGAAVADLAAENERVAQHLSALLARTPVAARDPVGDQLARTGLLALASDWAFMVSKDSAAGYARARHHGHHDDFRALAAVLESGDRAAAEQLAAALQRRDGPLPWLDARLFQG
jgi:1,4-alpha-glucan branching enzyme